MTANYDGLTKNSWPGTWAPNSNSPIALDSDLRGSLRSVSGEVNDRLTNIPGQRLNEGMVVYVKTGYILGEIERLSDTYYKYKLLEGESRDIATGAMPNSESNWSELRINSANSAELITPSAKISSGNLVVDAILPTNIVIDSFSKTNFQSGKYQLQVSANNNIQTCEIFISHDGVFSYYTISSEMIIGVELGTFETTVVNDNVVLAFNNSYLGVISIAYVNSLLNNINYTHLIQNITGIVYDMASGSTDVIDMAEGDNIIDLEV